MKRKVIYMTEKQLRYRIRCTEKALSKEHIKNVEKMANVGWGSGFRKQYVGPCCRRENELECHLKECREALHDLVIQKQDI